MNFFKIRPIHIRTLLLIQQGLIQEQIAKTLNEHPALTSIRVKRLVKEGYVLVQFRDVQKILALTPKAITLLQKHSHRDDSATSHTYNQESSRAKPAQVSIPPKRLNGARLYFKPFRTEFSKLEAKLIQAGIAFEQHRIRNNIQYELQWKGYSLKFTTQKLIAYLPEQFAGFSIDGKVLTDDAISKALPIINELLLKLDLRMLQKDGMLWFRLAYFEIAHTQSGTSKSIQKAVRKNYVPLAFNLKTGQIIAWADNSYKLHELEFNQHSIESKAANLIQDMADDKWDHRLEQARLTRTSQDILDLKRIALKHNERLNQLLDALLQQRASEPPLPGGEQRMRWN